ncbi:hypothetical protein NM208_g2399 [Fusarium decemcellulare]|uniref:Uncharacterized protein n=1 Tax=Fusarium decemcellulare TaxID=57161 RepID=A0ACC1ST93_9HYPO|nr:hypothetical protein NM208_g2399 [Fusarium decemcellulare]
MAPTPEVYHFAQTRSVPNSKLPVLVYRDVLPRPHNEKTIEEFLERNQWLKGGAWGPVPRHHFHPNSHECYGIVPTYLRSPSKKFLAVFQGTSTLLIGVGPLEDPADGQQVHLRAGDLIVLPAGVAEMEERVL